MTVFQKELIRKSTHTGGLIFLPLLFYKPLLFSALFLFFLLIYLIVEWADRKNISIPLLTWITHTSKRENEKNQLAWGAILLSLSCVILPLIFQPQIVALALTQTFTADAAAALAGMTWGKTKIPFTHNKSWVGSGVYWISAFLVSLIWVSPLESMILASAGCVIEVLSRKNIDNIAIPLGISFLASFFR